MGEWDRAYSLVLQHFRDEEKARLWMRTPNPMLGNLSPEDMIASNRTWKLLRFIEQAVRENG